MTDLRELLRAVPSVTGTAPGWDPADAPDEPRELFVEWLVNAVDNGAREPLAATLSTVDATGAPDARVLVIKNVTDDFRIDIATGLESAKGRQLVADPRCALTFYWSALARGVRVRGVAHAGTAAESAADFLARHPDARAIAATELQSSPMLDPDAHERLIEAQRARIASDPNLVSPTWTLWHIEPSCVEFWQGMPSRDHLRLRYTHESSGWRRERLWA
ncbi:pyridoxine/pyridoxamine 5'-phosphate oxidase [Humibacter ginsenosidimutans]|uniref:Pyridoxal 5'-phosphate synthase n=1 Tax=Humibacter ginsenosidimutans TaxID=2599293 RepID=A0A5B8M5P1_9MICO|nr:pyridoxal 5'-phosphate synthase [Humibacter ginsenosidimutans]QDZ15531.1 pyridoxal 5'-phosphate synthase [Humibacter ginsenosidimutans]